VPKVLAKHIYGAPQGVPDTSHSEGNNSLADPDKPPLVKSQTQCPLRLKKCPPGRCAAISV
jgi:hypothetical protein